MRYEIDYHQDFTATIALHDAPVGFQVDMHEIYNDIERASESFESQFKMTTKISFLSGVEDDVIVDSNVVMHIDFEGSTVPLAHACVGRVGSADIPVALRDDALNCAQTSFFSTRYELCARAIATSIARSVLAECGIDIYSYVTSVGDVSLQEENPYMDALEYTPLDIETSYVRCPDSEATQRMTAEIFSAKQLRATLPGLFRVVAFGLVPGLGDERSGMRGLNAQIAAALMSVDGVLSCSFGPIIHADMAHDATTYNNEIIEQDVHGFTYAHSYLGGLASGVTDGMPLLVSATVQAPWGAQNILPSYVEEDEGFTSFERHSINIETLECVESAHVYDEVCDVATKAAVAEGEVARVLLNACMKLSQAHTMQDLVSYMQSYRKRMKRATH